MLLLYAVGLAIATFVEKYTGTEMAKIIIYYSPIFFLLQILLVVNFILITIRGRYIEQKKWAYLLLHSALVIMLAGALASHLFAKEGMMHLREGETYNQMLVQTNRGGYLHDLPFKLKLQKFTITYYPGSNSPSSFESKVVVEDKKGVSFERVISMNNVLDIHGYRIFQSSYDEDGLGTILSVSNDLLGTFISYVGYICLFVGFIFAFFSRNSRFSYLIRQLKQNKNIGTLLLLLFFVQPLSSQNIDKNHTDRFGSLPMQSFKGRMEPINTFSSEVLRKIHHKNTFGEMNSDQFLLSLLAYPEMYSERPIIYLKNKNIANHYDLSEEYCSFNELFDSNGNYKLNADISTIYTKSPAERSRFEKDVMKLDEQANLFYQLINHGLLRIFPNEQDENHNWYAPGDDFSVLDSVQREKINNIFDVYILTIRNAVDTGDWELANKALTAIQTYQQKNFSFEIPLKKIELEKSYNKWDIFRQVKKTYLILGGLLLLVAFTSLFMRNRFLRILEIILTISICVAFFFHLGGLILRAYISGYVPWSNAYETMVSISFLTVASGFIFSRKSRLTLALAVLFGGIVLFVSGLNWMDPQITPLVPVLKSPWLMTHVATIVGAYGFFGISFLLSWVNLLIIGIQKKNQLQLSFRVKELTIINEISMQCGLFLMVTGTFIGAIWANESWGRYWGWDPKETWALITVVIYAIVLHMRLVKKWNNPVRLNWMAIGAFLCVLMTFFGVNYFLSGMHSYA